MAEKNVAVINSESNVIDQLLKAAASQVPVEALEKIMDLYERNERRIAERAFNKAFSEFKKNPPKIVKDTLVQFKTDRGMTSFHHASIGNIVASVIDGLSKHGLSHSWHMSQDQSRITVTCRLTHEMGHYQEASLTAGADTSGGKNAIQALASTTTYLQRYTLQAVTGIAILERDDDGRAHMEPKDEPRGETKKETRREGTISQEVLERWLDWIESFAEADAATLDRHVKTQLLPLSQSFSDEQWTKVEICINDTKAYIEQKGR